MPRPTATQRPSQPRPRRPLTQRQSLFDPPSPPADPSLLDDLIALVALGLLEQSTTPEGTAFALTELGEHTPEFTHPGDGPLRRPDGSE